MKKLVKRFAGDAFFIVVGVTAAWYINHHAYGRGYVQGVKDTADYVLLLLNGEQVGACERAPLPDAPAVFVRPRNGQDI